MDLGHGRLRGAPPALVLGLVISLLAVACGGSSATPSVAASGSGTGLDGTWLLTTYVSVDGTSINVPAAVTPTIKFDGDSVSGQAGCNTFGAVATIDGNQIGFGQVQSTKIACANPGATVEAAYLQALNLATTYTVTGNQLVITNPKGKPSLTFVRGS